MTHLPGQETQESGSLGDLNIENNSILSSNLYLIRETNFNLLLFLKGPLKQVVATQPRTLKNNNNTGCASN